MIHLISNIWIWMLHNEWIFQWNENFGLIFKNDVNEWTRGLCFHCYIWVFRREIPPKIRYFKRVSFQKFTIACISSMNVHITLGQIRMYTGYTVCVRLYIYTVCVRLHCLCQAILSVVSNYTVCSVRLHCLLQEFERGCVTMVFGRQM